MSEVTGTPQPFNATATPAITDASSVQSVRREDAEWLVPGVVREIVALCEAEEVERIVVGWPINMDGSEGPRCQSTRAFARNLGRLTDLPIAFWDERLSTVEAERRLRSAVPGGRHAGPRKRSNKGRRDALAASAKAMVGGCEAKLCYHRLKAVAWGLNDGSRSLYSSIPRHLAAPQRELRLYGRKQPSRHMEHVYRDSNLPNR